VSSNSDVEELGSKQICFKCVEEAYLSQEIKKCGVRERCSYCKKINKCYSIANMSMRIDEVFEQHYALTSDQPDSWQTFLLADKESNYTWEREGEPVVEAIINAAAIPESAAADIQLILDARYADFESAQMGEETQFSSESHYEEKGADDSRWQEEWQDFEQSLKTKARFFSQSAADHLNSVFADINEMATRKGKKLVIDAGPNCPFNALFRARVFQSDEKLKEALRRPDRSLGSPPSQNAKAGRMNAHGISVFYGATDAKVALAEVRPPVGSKVAIAKFEITRPVRLLDLTALSEVSTDGSIFDPSFSDRLERAMFLRSLSNRMTRSVMPDDEVFEYLPTQAIADFLATNTAMKIDGIAFPSVQAKGDNLNVVLFEKSARVADLDVPTGTEINVSLVSDYEEWWDTEYSVTEVVPTSAEEPESQKAVSPVVDWPAMLVSEVLDSREATLRIDIDSITINHVEAVKFQTNERQVSRHRRENHSNSS
jgi:hypothetical protein